MTPLHLAAESGRIKILNYLVDKGADINIQDDNGVIIGVSLRELHTSGTVCVYLCLLACLRPYTIILKYAFKYFPKIEHHHALSR